MNEMWERIATVIGGYYDGFADPMVTPNNWARAVRATQLLFEAMREPTEAMLARGKKEMNSQGAHDCEVPVADIFRAMMDEALKG